jgi:hypothetical protein
MDESKNIFILRNALRNTTGIANPRLYEDFKELVSNIVEDSLTDEDMSYILMNIFWKLEGNDISISADPATFFLGTTTDYPLNFKVYNQKAGRIDSDPSSSTIFGYNANNDLVNNNTVAIGYYAGRTINSPGNYNTIVGNWAAHRTNIMDSSVVIGYEAASNLDTSLSNVIIGKNAGHGYEDEMGYDLQNSVIIGTDAGKEIIDAGGIVAIGHSAAKDFTGITTAPIPGLNTSQSYGSVFIGKQAGESSTGTASAVIIGAQAGKLNTDAHSNTLIGSAAGENNFNENVGTYPNTAVGAGALRGGETAPLTSYTVLEGTCNVGVGAGAGRLNKRGWGNTYVGYLSGYDHGNSDILPDAYSFASNCVYIGHRAGRETIQDKSSILIGNSAGSEQGAEMGSGAQNAHNIAIGSSAMSHKKGQNNIAIGMAALSSNVTNEDPIDYNTAIGVNAISNLVTGQKNIGVGTQSLFTLTDGYNNTAIGENSLMYLTEGTNNTALGHGAAMSLEEGAHNVIIGRYADVDATTSYGTVVGSYASAAGNYSVSIGTGSSVTSSSGISVGQGSIVTGTAGISLGYLNTVSGSNSIVLGKNLTVTADDAIILGGTTTHKVGIGTLAPNTVAALDITSTTKGFLPPRMTTVQRDAIATPPAGLMLFNTTDTKLQCYDGAVWQNAW